MVGIVRAGSSHAQSGRSIRYGPRWRARRGASRRQPSASGEGAALDQSELLAGCTIVRPFNPGHVRHVHRSEVRMKLAHRVRRPLRRTLPRPAARTDDEPARLSRARQRIMARRRQRSHQPQTHVPPGGTPAPAPRLSPPMPGDGLLLGRGYRAALERTDQEDSAQNGWKDLPQRSSSQWAQSSVALSITWSARPSNDGGSSGRGPSRS